MRLDRRPSCPHQTPRTSPSTTPNPNTSSGSRCPVPRRTLNRRWLFPSPDTDTYTVPLLSTRTKVSGWDPDVQMCHVVSGKGPNRPVCTRPRTRDVGTLVTPGNDPEDQESRVLRNTTWHGSKSLPWTSPVRPYGLFQLPTKEGIPPVKGRSPVDLREISSQHFYLPPRLDTRAHRARPTAGQDRGRNLSKQRHHYDLKN